MLYSTEGMRFNMIQKYTFWAFGSLLWACGDEKKDLSTEDTSTNTQNPTAALEDIRIEAYASDLGTAYTMDNMFFGEDTAHTLSVYMFERHTSSEVYAIYECMGWEY